MTDSFAQWHFHAISPSVCGRESPKVLCVEAIKGEVHATSDRNRAHSDAGAGTQSEHLQHRAGAQAQAHSIRRHRLSNVMPIDSYKPQVYSPFTPLYVAVPPGGLPLSRTALG